MAGIAAEIATTEDNIFFIIGAPTKLTFSEFKKFYIKHGKEEGAATKHNVKLAICADIDTHKESLECENVFKTPTNFRAHGDDIGHAFLTMKDGVEHEKSLETLEDFKELQKDTAESIYDILKYARDNDIHTYFASVPRKLRPILLHKELGDKDKQIKMIEDDKKLEPDVKDELKKILEEKINGEGVETKYSKDEDGKSVYPHIISGPYILEKFDHDLTTQIYNKIKEKGILENLIKNINNEKISKHGATFLADVITVGCALLIDDKTETAWKHYDISFGEDKDKGEKKTKTKKYWENSNFKFGNLKCKIPDVEQENISYEENASGLFHGFDAKKALTTLTDEMKKSLDLENFWGDCYVWHDAELNDVDDEPAIKLIEQLSTTVNARRSYNPVSSGGGYKKSYGKKKKTKKTRRKTKNMRKKSKTKTKTKKKNTRKKKHYKKRKSKTHKKR